MTDCTPTPDPGPCYLVNEPPKVQYFHVVATLQVLLGDNITHEVYWREDYLEYKYGDLWEYFEDLSPNLRLLNFTETIITKDDFIAAYRDKKNCQPSIRFINGEIS